MGNFSSFGKINLREFVLEYVLEYTWLTTEIEAWKNVQANLTQGSLRALLYARKQEESLSTAVMGGFPDDGWSEC